MSDQVIKSDLLVDLPTEEQQLLSGGRWGGRRGGWGGGWRGRRWGGGWRGRRWGRRGWW